MEKEDINLKYPLAFPVLSILLIASSIFFLSFFYTFGPGKFAALFLHLVSFSGGFLGLYLFIHSLMRVSLNGELLHIQIFFGEYSLSQKDIILVEEKLFSIVIFTKEGKFRIYRLAKNFTGFYEKLDKAGFLKKRKV
ncbi:MAG: hypothetical protein H7A25_00860 [Leptospiraceae bacterium]|nr:hypothetical protein [Leptospiraceae bacterium]MCP5498427.1 hypothetical protein [Leptospiraceae bacterium]